MYKYWLNFQRDFDHDEIILYFCTRKHGYKYLLTQLQDSPKMRQSDVSCTSLFMKKRNTRSQKRYYQTYIIVQTVGDITICNAVANVMVFYPLSYSMLCR